MLITGRIVEGHAFPSWVVMFLAFLILVLCFHFLFEDLSFSTTSDRSITGYPTQGEITHEDDIVQPIEQSPHIAANPVVHISPVLLPVRFKIFIFHFNPPNI